MGLRKLLLSFCVAALFANTSLGSILATYNATNFTGGNHGLWTSSSQGLSSSNNPHWTIDAVLSVVDDFGGAMDGNADYVTLVGTLTNQNGTDTGLIDLTFSNYIGSDYAGNGIAPKGIQHGDENAWDYFTAVQGTIKFSLGNQVITIDEMEDGPDRAFQLGLGANDKNGEFGASSWVESSLTPAPGGLPNSPNHWDLNLKLTETPEPSTFVIWSAVGLVGVGYTYSRRRQRAA